MKIQELIESTIPPALMSIRRSDSMPECWSSMNLDEMLDLMDGAKKGQRQAFAPSPDMPDTIVDRGPEFSQTLKRYPSIADRFDSWIKAKMASPLSLIGYDKPFVPKSPYAGLMHAHMDDDVSVVYRLVGRDPRHIKVYGFYSHEDLGTNKASKPRIQQNVSRRLLSQVFEQ
jgi:hypothetical protein